MSEINPPRPSATPPKRGIIKKILECGIYALVFLLPWQTKLILRQEMLNRGDWEYGTIALYGADILLIGLLILALILSLRGVLPRNDKAIAPLADEVASQPRDAGLLRFARNDKIVWMLLSGLDLFIFISIFFAPDKILAAYRYVLFLLGLGLFWLIIKAEYSKTKLAGAFISGLIIQGALAIQQFLTQGTYAFKWLGLAAHSPGDLGASVVETIGAGGIPERWLRAYGSLDHPNILGGLLAIGAIILVWLIVNYQRADKKETDWKFIIYHLSFVIISAGLIFSFSRSALTAFAIGLIIFFIFYLIKKDRPAIKKIGGSAILFIVLLSLVFINYQNLFFTRVGASARLEAKSLSERKMYLDDSFSLLKKDWLFGVGAGNYTKALSEKDSRRPWYYLQPVHNAFLLAGAEIGVFGFLFFSLFFIYLFGRAIKEKNAFGLSILAALAIIMMLDHYLWSLHFGILFFWLAAGIVYKNNNSDN